MGHYEDAYYEIYNKVTEKGIISVRYNQLKKMERQDKHKYKSTKERWEYAYNRITSSLS